MTVRKTNLIATTKNCSISFFGSIHVAGREATERGNKLSDCKCITCVVINKAHEVILSLFGKTWHVFLILSHADTLRTTTE